MTHVYDVIIIGGGPAGYTAALYSARAGLDTAVIEKMSIGGQLTLTGEVENYPGFADGIDGYTLGANMQSGAEKFGAQTIFDEVTNVFLDEKIKRVVTQSTELYARSVIIASGASPRELGIDGESDFIGKGIHYCAHCDGRFYKNKTVAVIGGGNSAVSDALYLSRLAKKVYLVHRRDSLRATKIYHEPLKNAENVEILWNSRVSKLLHGERIVGAILENTATNEQSELLCDAIFVSIGRKPNTSLFNGVTALDENGYIIADESTKTSVEGVFAAGDVRTKTLRQIVTAVSDGATAAHYAEEYISLSN
jgi:thioredoxin reductase (NADPH)